MYKGTPIRLLTDFSAEKCRPEVSGMTYSNYWKKKNGKPIIIYPTKSSFRIEGATEFSRQVKAESVHVRLALQEMLKGVL